MHQILSVILFHLPKGVLLKIHYKLIDAHRDEWMAVYRDYPSFNENFELSDELMQLLIEEGEREGIEYNEEQYRKSAPILKLQLKALIARDLWDMSEYYQTINAIDEGVKKAVELLEREDFENLLKKKS